ncbi:cupin domain-containing protein [Haliangium ochraceum]|uniref:Cupin 2 conserved barrel domain protein n=1 Tax=Haliangium ochraceum (strain DSM 14365 / JCM 11303 / SMP-2) TaxID=502025 RepID=D0LXI1_HALO1|nr:cupin domain-containing protein [Haliangium ochraceum]ACY17736.1 Cupin 2 conserved barrel domain protein [Haliangium ochraceum DSM 14365]
MTPPKRPGNLLAALPADLGSEVFEDLIRSDGVRIERIVSRGHATPEGEWYDQDQHEWVMVMSGEGVIGFADGATVTLGPGDYLHLPAHCKHRVVATAGDRETVWLAVFYG